MVVSSVHVMHMCDFVEAGPNQVASDTQELTVAIQPFVAINPWAGVNIFVPTSHLETRPTRTPGSALAPR